MSTGIGGKTREVTEGLDNTKYVGMFKAEIIAINPTIEQFKEKLGIELKEDSKATDYLGESKEGNTTLRVDFWLEDVVSKNKFKKSFFLEDKVRENKDSTKTQYINDAGNCSWSEDGKKFPDFFKARTFREANIGEEKLYNFLKIWLGSLDLRDPDSTLMLDWKKLMKGNVKELKDQISGDFALPFVALAMIKTVEKTNDEGETTISTYQSIYDEILPAYTFDFFTKTDYDNSKIIEKLNNTPLKNLKQYEKFVVGINGAYGAKDFFKLKPIDVYREEENIASSNEPSSHSEEDSEY